MDKTAANFMLSGTNCGVCNKPLAYPAEPTAATCALCGKKEFAVAYCTDGHYVCESCHSKAALEVLKQVLSTTKSTDPAVILEEVMCRPEIPMRGCVHHAMVAGAVLCAVRNTGYDLPDDAEEEAFERAARFPDGSCGFYGICGAAVGVGIAVSIITGAAPALETPRARTLTATAYASSFIVDDLPRCCLRASRIAVAAAKDFLRDFLSIDLPSGNTPRCVYLLRNPKCAEEACPFCVGVGMEEKSSSYHD